MRVLYLNPFSQEISGPDESLRTLLGALVQNGKDVDGAASRAALDRLFQQLENPSGYDPRRFAPQLRRVAELLPRN